MITRDSYCAACRRRLESVILYPINVVSDAKPWAMTALCHDCLLIAEKNVVVTVVE